MSPLPRPLLPLLATLFATIFLIFGINALLRPAHALSFFFLDLPAADSPARATVDALLAVYAVRDIFVAVPIYATAWFGSRRALGWVLVGVAGVAWADGVVVRVWSGEVGGEWTHWGYAPVVGVVGGLLVGGW